MKIQRTIPAAAWSRRRTAVLLRAVNPVRKLVVRHHVIELPSRLIEPGTPSLAAVARNNRALIATKNHPPRLVGINPKFVVVVAPRRAFECGKRLTSVMRLISCGVRDEHSIGVLRIHTDFPEVPTALPDAPVIRNTLPTLPAVVRTKQPALLGVHDQINPPRIARRKSNSDSPKTLRWQSLSGHVIPMVASINRAIKPAARPVRRRVDAPRWPSRLPQRGKNGFWISRLECQIDRACILIVKKNLLPALSPIFRKKHPALLVRLISVTKRGHKNSISVPQLHKDPPNLPRILQPDVRPGLAAVRR